MIWNSKKALFVAGAALAVLLVVITTLKPGRDATPSASDANSAPARDDSPFPTGRTSPLQSDRLSSRAFLAGGNAPVGTEGGSATSTTQETRPGLPRAIDAPSTASAHASSDAAASNDATASSSLASQDSATSPSLASDAAATSPSLGSEDPAESSSDAFDDGSTSSSTASADSATSPSATLSLWFAWAGTRQPVADLTVEVRRGHVGSGERLTGITDQTGFVRILHPADWTEAQVLGYAPRAYAGPLQVLLPQAATLPLAVERAYSAFGEVCVRDEKGQARPIGGATVAAKSRFPQRTVTDTDGTWRLDAISESNTTFLASREELASSLGGRDGYQVLLKPGIDNGPFFLYLDRVGLAIVGAVVRADDLTPIAGASVIASKLAAETITDENGRFILDSLTPGTVELTVSAEGYTDALFAVTLDGDRDATAMIHMKPAATIRVAAVDCVSAPVYNATVHLISSEGAHTWPVATDTRGRADLPRLDATCTYTVYAWCRGTDSNFENVSFDADRMEANVKLAFPFNVAEEIAKGPKAVYQGTVTSEGHWPIAGATVMFRQNWDLDVRLRDVKKKTVTGPDGRFYVEFVKFSPDSCEASVCAEGWATQWKQVSKGGTVEEPLVVDFVLRPERTLRGRVADSSDRALSGVAVQVWPASGYDHFFPGQPETLTAPDGTFWVRGLDGDSVRVFLTKTNWDPIVGQIVRTDDTEFRLVMQSRGAIRGCVVDAETQEPIPDLNVWVRGPGLSEEDMRLPHKFYAEDGRFVIEGLADGQLYQARIETPRYATLERQDLMAGPSAQTEEVLFSMSRE